jgi:hypothetical protein
VRAAIGLAIILAGSSCGSPARSPSAPPAEPSPAPTPDAPAPSKQDLVAAAIARVAEIQKTVAKLRGLPFRSPVPAQYQSKEDFRAYLVREVQRELPPELDAKLSRAVFHLGLVKQPVALGELLLDAFVSQAGAYYDPQTNRFYIVMLSSDASWLDAMSAHELMHGIQHQHFDLIAYYMPDAAHRLTEDELNARRFIVEGEATMMMLVYLGDRAGKDMLGADRATLSAQLSAMSSLDTATLIKLQKAQSSSLEGLDDDMRQAIEAMDRIPHFVLVPLIDSYIRGTLPVMEAYAAGGWDAVAKLFAQPPESTEQVLHPTTKLFPTRDYPVVLELPDTVAGLDDYKADYGDVLGELQWRTYLGTWDVAEPARAAEGWDGDRYTMLVKGDATAAVAVTTWDSPADAQEFETAYLASLAARFPSGARNRSAAVTRHARPDGTVIAVERRGSDVLIADGVPAATATKSLMSLRKAKRRRHPGESR